MRKENWSIGLACALGAFIGALSALEIQSYFAYGSYFWAFGALFGGLVSYLAVDFKEFWAGIALAFRRTIAWRPYTQFWRAFFVLWCGVLIFFTSVISTGVALLDWDARWLFFLIDLDRVEFLVMWLTLVGLSTLLVSILFLPESRGNLENDATLLTGIEKGGWWLMRNANPLVGLCWVVHGTIVGIQYTTVHLPPFVALKTRSVCAGLREAARTSRAGLSEAAKSSRLFVARAFIYVHSERRVLCFVDATIGAAIGYFFGNAIIGAVAGAILGVVSYEVVSVRWLKIAPAKIK